MSAAAKDQRRAAKGALTKAIGRLKDVVAENFSAYNIQRRIDEVKDALESSVDKNEVYREHCETEQVVPDQPSDGWEAAETTRVDDAVKDAIAVMKQLKMNAEQASKDNEAMRRKISRKIMSEPSRVKKWRSREM